MKRTRLVHTERFVVSVEVEAVVPADDPSEPCYESETVELLKLIEEHARRGDREWLLKRGAVYERVAAA